MAAWCLPKQYANAFLDALKAGSIDPAKLAEMSTAERRAFFAKVVGEDNAREINALFESKMLLKDQQRGLVNWAQSAAGLSEPARRDILGKIEKLDRVLQPDEERAFLADLAARKLGVTVTADEARGIFSLSQAASTAKAEMLKDLSNVMNRVAYGRSLMNLAERLESLKPQGRSFSSRLIDILNIPKSALTSVLHFSAPFVQGWGMLSTKRAWEAFGQMFRYFASEENYRNLDAYIITHPDYDLALSGKLGLTKLGDKLTAREEAIQSTLIERFNEFLTGKTGLPHILFGMDRGFNLVRASSRAFTGYLNYVRFNRFADLVTAARMAGEDVRAGSPAVRDLAKVVNDFTGRGAIGKDDQYASVVPALNAAFFSPRKISATIQMFNPVRYLNPAISRTARIAAIRQLSGSLVATGTVIALAKSMGLSVDLDPRSTDFAKIGIGGEKFDLSGGNAIYLRLLARIASNQEITSKDKLIDLGEGYKPTTRADLLTAYFRDKLSPIAGALADALYGTDPIGRPFSVTQEMQDKLIPITIGDFIHFAMYDPDNTAAMLPALSAIFGVQVELPLPPMSKSGRDVWGDPVDAFGSVPNWRTDPVNRELQALGYTPGFPAETIRGVKLDAKQYDDYVRVAGRYAHSLMQQAVETPGWQTQPAGWRLQQLQRYLNAARRSAQSVIISEDQSIVTRAADAKAARLGLAP